MTAKAYVEGSTYPELEKNTLRLYSMRFCPYAQRTRIVLAHHNIPHEVVNINLKQKPEWFTAKTPGLVPVLEQNDRLVFESAICDEYLDEVYGTKKLLPSDPYEKARMKYLMEYCSKVIEKYYGLFRASDETVKQKALEDLRKLIKTFENSIKGKYLFGDELSMLDLHIWPWIERIPAIEKIHNITVLPAEEFPKLTKWVQTMLNTPAIKKTWFDADFHEAIHRQYLTGGAVDYDVGL